MSATVRDHLLNAEDVAEMLGISAYKVYEMAKTRQIPAIHLGRLWRFRESSLIAWIEKQESAAK